MLKDVYIWGIHFRHMYVHKYTRVARDQDGMKVKVMINLMLIKRDMLKCVHVIKTVRGLR